MTPNRPMTGFFPGMPYDQYREHEAIAKSDLDSVNESPAMLLWKQNAPTDSRVDTAGTFGNAAHTFVLEPKRFESEYIIQPKINKSTKAGKEEAKEFEKLAVGRVVLKDDDFTTIKLMRESVMAHPTACEIIESMDYAESSIFYDDPETGLMCKARPDIICSGFHVVADLKFIKSITKWLHRDILDYRYHIQECHYSKAYKAHFGKTPTFLFIFVSKERQFGQYKVKVARLDNQFLELAQEDRRRNLKSIKECRESDEYDGIERIFLA